MTARVAAPPFPARSCVADPTNGGFTRLAELTPPGRPLLVDFTDSSHLADLTGPWRDRVDLVTARAPAPPADALLIRPDGYVAWALGPDGDDHLLEALETWFGDPRRPGPPA